MKKLLCLLGLTLLFFECNRPEPPMEIYLRSYVMGYYDVEKIYLTDSYDYHPEDDSRWITVFLKDPSVRGTGSNLGDYKSTGALKKSYDNLCEKHNDMTYNRTDKLFGTPYFRTVPGVDFISIDVVSNADFDEAHYAGESLGDIVMFSTSSLKPYIDSGYSSLYSPENYPNQKLEYHPIGGVLSEITPDQLVLLAGGSINLIFESEPTLSKTHTFTVTMTADDGRVFSESIEVTFE